MRMILWFMLIHLGQSTGIGSLDMVNDFSPRDMSPTQRSEACLDQGRVNAASYHAAQKMYCS